MTAHTAMTNRLSGTQVQIKWVNLVLLVTLFVPFALYFYIFLYSHTDLQQMRRICLTGAMVALAGLIAPYLLLECFRIGFRAALQNRQHICLLAFTVLVTTSVGITFQMRLSDAYRHAYASAFLSYYVSPEIAQDLGNLVEWVTSYKSGILFSSAMDQCNNYSGRQIAVDIKKQGGSWQDSEQRIDSAYKTGDLILSRKEHKKILSCYERFFPDELEVIIKMGSFTQR